MDRDVTPPLPEGRSDTADSVGPAPPAARRVADEVARRFGLGGIHHVEEAPGGMLNQNLRVATAGGGYFFKGYRYSDPAPILREHSLVVFAAGCGVPAVAPLAAPGGQTAVRAGGRWWAVFPLLTDRQVRRGEVSAEMARSLGRALGQIHVTLARLPAAEAKRYPPRLIWSSAQANDSMAWYEGEIARRPALDPFDQHALSSFSFRRTLVGAGVPPPSAFDPLPSQVLHGDYHEGNVFFDASDNVSGVIDWELACQGPRAWEIVRAMDLALDLPADVDAGGERVRAFLHSYAAVAPLTVPECHAMPELYWATRVHSLWVYDEHYRRGGARTDRLAMQDIAHLEWWTRQRGSLALWLAREVERAPRALILGDR